MGSSQTVAFSPFCLPTKYGWPQTAKQDNKSSDEDIFKKQEQEYAQAILKAQESYAKKISYIRLRTQSEDVINNIHEQEAEAEKAYKQLEKNKNLKGGTTADSGQKGFLRWVANAGTALCNMGKSIIGIDKDGNWDPVKCVTNLGITAAAIGATFIPYIGPVIGYSLLAAGVIGATAGVINGMSELDKAERSGDQRKIDEAQQDICGNAFIGITSIFGLRGIGKAFRTSSATAESASYATARSSMGGKCVEAVSNFGRDITVNAFRGTKAAMHADEALIAAKGGVWSAFKSKISSTYNKNAGSWEKQYNIRKQEMETTLNNKITDINAKIATETNPAKQALLQEERQLLEANLTELKALGNTIKSKADFDKLAKDNMEIFNREYINNGFNKTSAGDIDINGTIIKQREFLTFRRRIMQQQRTLEKELQKLIKAKENMMRTYASKGDKYKTQLDEYISTSGVKRSKWKPSHWIRNDYELALDGKNPGSTGITLFNLLTTPGSNVAKASGMWIDPIYSDALLLTQELSPEEAQAQFASLTQAIETIKNIRYKLDTAKNAEELTAALTEYQQLVNAAQGGEQTQGNPTQEGTV